MWLLNNLCNQDALKSECEGVRVKVKARDTNHKPKGGILSHFSNLLLPQEPSS